jgi:hypothetical protein
LVARHGVIFEKLVYVQFNVLLSWRALEEKDQWDHAENDAAKRAELVHVREQHRLALHGLVKVRQSKVAMICDIAWRSHRPADGLLHKAVCGSDVRAEDLLVDLRVALKHRTDERDPDAAALVAHQGVKTGSLRAFGLRKETEHDGADRDGDETNPEHLHNARKSDISLGYLEIKR